MISGKTRVCGLMGYPVAHSMSPFIQGKLAEAAGDDIAYVTFPVKPGSVGEAVRGAEALGICGMNVTVPHKKAVIPFLVSLDPGAEKVGAVNTLVPQENGGYKGYNTDVIGLRRAFGQYGIDTEGRDVMIIGAGGGARAAAFVCAEGKASHIYIMNRSVEKGVALAEDVNKSMEMSLCSGHALDDVSGLPGSGMIAVQATSVGLSPDIDSSPVEDEGILGRADTVFDLIYTPAETKFMRLAKERGAKAYNGLWMLVWQAVSAYELWTGHSVDEETARRVYDEVLLKINEN
ncbi:MAG: shikimate dehydrogenase [Lachnospiraceae bacterium]|nr:shikimate dehydrogenase [Lachnospiraceae bacterium]